MSKNKIRFPKPIPSVIAEINEFDVYSRKKIDECLNKIKTKLSLIQNGFDKEIPTDRSEDFEKGWIFGRNYAIKKVLEMLKQE